MMNAKQWRLITLGVGALIFAISSYQIIQRPLWGHWCLPWFLSFWLLLVLLFGKSSFSSPGARKRLAASSLTGVLLFLGFPTMPLTPLLFVAFIPILWVIETLQAKEGKTGKSVLFYSFNAFLLWNILSTYWVTNTAFVAGIFAIGLNSFFMAGVFWLFSRVAKRFRPQFKYWALAAFWISFEYLHLHWELSWSWLNLGNAWAQYPSLIQWYDHTGIFGGSLWIWIVNILGIQWLLERNQPTTSKGFPKQLIVISLIIVLPVLLSLFIYHSYEEKGTEVHVSSVQPNFEPQYEKFSIQQDKQLERYLFLANECVTDSTDFLVFPETSFGYFDIQQLDRYTIVRSLREFLGGYSDDLSLVTGLSSYRLYDSLPDGKDLYRRENSSGIVQFRETQNSAVLLRSQNIPEIHLKSKLVPGAEIFPYKRMLPFLTPIIKKLGGSMSDWGSQKMPSVFRQGKVPVAPIICYESIFGEYVGKYIKQGAQILFVVTNDGWWDDTMGHKQHAIFSSLRAIEYRKPVVRSANMGWCAFINQRGDLSQIHDYGVMHCTQGTVLANDRITFYTRWGDVIARIACFMSGLIALSALMYPFRVKK